MIASNDAYKIKAQVLDVFPIAKHWVCAWLSTVIGKPAVLTVSRCGCLCWFILIRNAWFDSQSTRTILAMLCSALFVLMRSIQNHNENQNQNQHMQRLRWKLKYHLDVSCCFQNRSFTSQIRLMIQSKVPQSSREYALIIESPVLLKLSAVPIECCKIHFPKQKHKSKMWLNAPSFGITTSDKSNTSAQCRFSFFLYSN